MSLSSAHVLVVGVARNCEKSLRREVLTMGRALQPCRAVSWLVVESDSTDKTAWVLSQLEQEIMNFRALSLGVLEARLPLRTQRIAHCRNTYLAELHANPVYAKVDYVIVADLDGVNPLLSCAGLASCWSRPAWDVCTANQRGPYYDLWALRHELWNPTDCWQQYRFLVAHGARPRAARYAAVYSKMITVAEASEWIEVESAFGGLAVYRRAALAGLEYAGVSSSGDAVCEHVPLHQQIKAKGRRILINPRLINAAYTPHSQQLRLSTLLGRW